MTFRGSLATGLLNIGEQGINEVRTRKMCLYKIEYDDYVLCLLDSGIASATKYSHGIL